MASADDEGDGSRERQCKTSISRWIRFVKPSISAIYVTIHVTVNFWCSEKQRKIEVMEPTSGLEPLTCRLRIGCSTN
jgi:hypothetical protein